MISNEEIDDIMKVVKSLKESGFLIKSVSKAIKNEAKIQESAFLNMLLGTLSVGLLGNLLTGKSVQAKITGQGLIKACRGAIATIQGRGTIEAGQDF